MFVVLDKVLTTRDGFHKSGYLPKDERTKQKEGQEVPRILCRSCQKYLYKLCPTRMSKCRLQTHLPANGRLLKPDKHHRIRIEIWSLDPLTLFCLPALGQATSHRTCVTAFGIVLGYCLLSELPSDRDSENETHEPSLLPARLIAEVDTVSDAPSSACRWRRHCLHCGIGCLCNN